MQETQGPSCDCCGQKQVRKWICEGCSFNQKLQGQAGSQVRDTIAQLQWSSNKKHTPPTYYATKSSRQIDDSPGSFRDYMFSKRQDNQEKSKSRFASLNKGNETHYMFCRYHDQPLSFYNKQSKEILCSICLFQKGALSKSSKIKESTLLPLKASIDLVRLELKQIVSNLTQSSNNLEQSIKICRRSQQSIKYHQNKLCSEIQQISEIMIQQIKIKQKQSKTSIKLSLGNLLEQYQLKQSKYRQLSGDTRQLKFLASKSRELKSDQLAYLFESAKEMRQQIKMNYSKTEIFDPLSYHFGQFNKRRFKQEIDNVFNFHQVQSATKLKKNNTNKSNKDSILKNREKSLSALKKF